MANPSVFDHLRPFWAHLDSFGPFQTKINFLLRGTSAKPYFVHLGQKNNFCLKWSKRVQMGPKRLVQWHNVKLQIREICKMQQSRDRLQVDLSAPLPPPSPSQQESGAGLRQLRQGQRPAGADLAPRFQNNVRKIWSLHTAVMTKKCSWSLIPSLRVTFDFL